jgi:peptide/nickel transport system substrate-binding protein
MRPVREGVMAPASAVLLGLGLGLVGSMPAVAQQNVLRVALSNDIRSVDPGLNRDGNTDGVVMHMVEGLVTYREDTTVGLMLAKSLDVSPDGKTYTFKLRDGVKFHNGATLTADDVLFTWNRYMDPKNNWRCLPDYNGQGQATVESVMAPDPTTVVYTVKQPSTIFLATLARVDCGGTAVWHRSSLDAEGKMKVPIGTGPFKFGEWKRGEYIELVKFDDYSALPGERDGNTGNKTAYVDKVRFMVIPDQQANKAAILSGAIDVISGVGESDVAEFRKNNELKVDIAPSMEVNGLLIQTRDRLLKDVRIRQAIMKSLDLKQIAEAVTDGLVEPSLTIMPSSSPYYGKLQAQVPERDVAGAKRLLAEAGYKSEPIRMISNKQNASMYNQGVLVQQMAKEAGINIEMVILDWATQLDLYNKGNYQLMSNGYSARLDPSLSFDMVSGPKDRQPRKLWENPRALDLLARSMQVGDKAERQEIFDEMEKLWREDLPMIGFFSSAQISVSRANIIGYKNWSLGQPRAWGVKKE